MGKTRETDYIQQLAGYIKKNLSKGYTVDSLKWALISQGHSRTEIARAVQLANEQLAYAAPRMVEKPIINVQTEPPIDIKMTFWEKLKSWVR
jgi:hypothetical protein